MPAVTRRGRHRGEWALRGADMLTTIAAIALLQVSGAAQAAPTGDRCEVYLVDVQAALAAQQASEKGASDDELRRLAARAETALGTFTTTIGEEELTTHAYALPDHTHVTVTVFYTDESMASAGKRDSVQAALAVGAAAVKDARDVTGNAFAEVPYDSRAFKVRVKQYATLSGREHLLGVECSSSARPPR